VTVEPDLSNAGPFLAAALVTAGTVTVAGWPGRTTQPAAQILDGLTQMGAVCTATADGLRLTGSGEIRGVTADLRDVSELTRLTALAALAGRRCSPGSPSAGAGEHRLAALAARSARSAGMSPARGRPGVRQAAARDRGGFASHDDHRLVMAAACSGARSAAERHGGKMFPGFPGDGRRCWDGRLSGRIGYAGLDEDDVRVRPGKGSRPRTRRRPAHEDAAQAFVAAVDRGRYRCFVGDRAVTAMGARELGHRRVVVGDLVRLAGDTSGAPGALARVVSVLPRTSVLRRSADDSDPVERVIVANAEQLVIVCALADPPPRTRLIDRFLVAAYDAGLDPLLCLTKADLAPPDEILATYAPLGLRHVVTGRGPGAEVVPGDLCAELAGRASVLVGHSGVGKSTR
jgi:hypothetical protein